MTLDDATRRQIEAARPDANTWLSANAGSGKTRVLTDRVARLLLAGAPPQNILCLTYTKAAASEMQNRLFGRLGAWAMMGDAELREELQSLGAGMPEDLGVARRLFAQAIETPGGLKIQTIHAFCAAILRRFPMEAGVNPNFKEMDERSALLLQDEVLEEMASGTGQLLVEAVARHHSGAEFAELTRSIAGKAKSFRQPADMAAIKQALGLAPDLAESDLVGQVFGPGTGALIEAAIEAMEAGSATMQKRAAELRLVDRTTPGPEDLARFQSVVLTKTGTVLKDMSAKALTTALAGASGGFLDLCARAEDAHQAMLALRVARRSFALHSFAHAFVAKYERAKAQRGWLDFDDLIDLTAQLLTQSEVAQWVLFRLEGGIDHILVDEAQDTSPDQWRVIRSIADEFMSGEGLHANRDWSIFVVGDPKQSIYSFQGADPAEFARVRQEFGSRLTAIEKPLAQLPLEHSFRSAPAILSVVDSVLAEQPGLGDIIPHHLAFHDTRPGRVDLWPLVEKAESEKPKPWHDPVDMPSPEDHTAILAKKIAEEVARLIDEERLPTADGARPVEPGDILVLVQGRSALFRAIIAQCKAHGIPIAGADRLKIGAEMAVKDLTALLSFLATPEDDLSLAALLRSPLFGWSEDDLYRLAQPREGYLWQALRNSEGHPAKAILQDMLDQADFLRPYDLLDRMLTRHDGRRLLTGRLGHEAVDGIDAVLAQALSYEQLDVPSLTGFLTWLAAAEVEIKRQMDRQRNEMRVMTVHGAKGLEAPIVILPDTAVKRPMDLSPLMPLEGTTIWRPSKAELPASLLAEFDAARSRETEEKMRLLYVAMTRAESWLIVAGAGEAGKEPGKSWHDIVMNGLHGMPCITQQMPTGAGLRYQTGDWPVAAPGRTEKLSSHRAALPDWMTTHAPTPPRPPRTLSPSDLGGDMPLTFSATPGQLDQEAAKRRGRQIHRLLEFLPTYPRTEWDHHARALLAFGDDAADDATVAELVSEVRITLDNPDLAHLFDGDALAEVGISAPTDKGGATRLVGIIDRLILTPSRVTAIDFKSNIAVPARADDVPDSILRQMGAYAEALGKIYTDREVGLAVLWTRTGTLMDIPLGLASAAFSVLDAADADT
ncbi:double-strand break repair helicase AddA [Maritimibacter sp. DP1N21-5]|uniref:double-strand break repair helicase AddA n=1 Tax=Maritimibacter sp. DP1N21-5 TaxID=2836867 RepID=UPI001C444AFC|nr:double-strand break repair helicase AddA [Maritimibacter sp. DP1N21-5]MBV7410985.1 double-strand break repair helicase AddA [Maritimibacter sp. DP1N21-5]